MAVSIRLRRMGRKKKPHYRVVVADRLSPRDGRFIESVGYYKPLTEPARLVLDLERVDYWLGVGAEPTGTVPRAHPEGAEGGRHEGRPRRAGAGGREGPEVGGARRQASGESLLRAGGWGGGCGRGRRGGRQGTAGVRVRRLRRALRRRRAAGG